jgi:hypothetical protein
MAAAAVGPDSTFGNQSRQNNQTIKKKKKEERERAAEEYKYVIRSWPLLTRKKWRLIDCDTHTLRQPAVYTYSSSISPL